MFWRGLEEARPREDALERGESDGEPRHLLQPAAHDDDDVVAWLQSGMKRTQRLTNESLGPVALDRLAHALAGDDRVAILGWIQGIGQNTSHERTIGERPAALPDLVDFCLSPQSQPAFHKRVASREPQAASSSSPLPTLASQPLGRTGVEARTARSSRLLVLRKLLLVRNRQLVAPLEPAAIQDEPAAPGRHPRQEAVLALARDALRLVGSLRHLYTLPPPAGGPRDGGLRRRLGIRVLTQENRCVGAISPSATASSV